MYVQNTSGASNLTREDYLRSKLICQPVKYCNPLYRQWRDEIVLANAIELNDHLDVEEDFLAAGGAAAAAGMQLRKRSKVVVDDDDNDDDDRPLLIMT